MAGGTGARAIASGAVRVLRGSWRSLATTDLAYKAVAFALLTPAVTLVLRWLRSSASSTGVVADVDILWFFVTTPQGVATLVVGSSLILAISAVEAACLMAIGIAAAQGQRLDARGALAFGASRAPKVLELTARMLVVVLAVLLPFLAAAAAVYWTLLREHDINYYLSQRPPELVAAVALVAVLVVALAVLLARTVARWALALPILLFDEAKPRQALAASVERSAGHRGLILTVLAGWALVALALSGVAASLPALVGRLVAPRLGDSLALLLLFLGGLALLWAVLALVAGIVGFSLFALAITGLYLDLSGPRGAPAAIARGATAEHRRLSGRARLAVAAVAALAAVGLAGVAFLVTPGDRPVLVIAHRGASASAPENTLAAFRLAAEQGADFVELDVQESGDGEVVVVHDSDLMKVGGDARKIWEADAAELRMIDIGSHAGAQFSAERVPTLAEALAVCKGRCRVVVELKSYGHDQRLEERVAAIVEAAGMESDCIFMSLDHDMVRRMKQLRPAWRTGALVAKAIGDPTRLDADFLAVEARMATRAFVRRAHGAGRDVYVWTVNQPAPMLLAMGRGVDGLITDHPELGRGVTSRRAAMSDTQRFLTALLLRFGASDESIAATETLRP